jgi:hypothetical protein
MAGGDDRLLALAEAVAEEQLDIERVRRTSFALIERAWRDPNYTTAAEESEMFAALRRMHRAEKRGLAPQGADIDLREELLGHTHKRAERYYAESPAERHARILAALAMQLAKLDRYERRALSRRKSAVRRFDAAQRALADEREEDMPLSLRIFNLARAKSRRA